MDLADRSPARIAGFKDGQSGRTRFMQTRLHAHKTWGLILLCLALAAATALVSRRFSATSSPQTASCRAEDSTLERGGQAVVASAGRPADTRQRSPRVSDPPSPDAVTRPFHYPDVGNANPVQPSHAPQYGGAGSELLRASSHRNEPRGDSLPPLAPVQLTSYLGDSDRGDSQLPMPTRMDGLDPPDRTVPQPFPDHLRGETDLPVRVPTFSEQGAGGERARWATPVAAELESRRPLIRGLLEAFSGEQAPASGPAIRIPMANSVPPGAVQVDSQTGLVSIVVRDAPLNEILGVLAEQQGLNIITAEDITAKVSVTIHRAPFDEALANILSVAGYACLQQGDFLLVTSVTSGSSVPPQVQGREIRVFALDYVSAADVDLVVKGLLSPVGQSFISTSDEADRRRTQELLIVEDLPAYLRRIEQTVRQMDKAPRQVLIEANVLSVELEEDERHGVNFSYLDYLKPVITLETTGFADLMASPALMLNLDEYSLKALVELLTTTKDAKTLASPKVFVLNGQQAKIQIGQQLGYLVTTTTQTSTMESVEFLEVGVILTVTPHITPDNRVVMNVKPVVSSGEINPDTKLPDEETTEVETSVMLPDGRGIVIGGLIQEEDLETQQKVPLVGDLWLVGRLFQRRETTRRRNEIIITLIPHVVPFQPECQQRESQQYERATTPLVYGPLCEYPRPFEPRLPDAGQRPAILCGPRRTCRTSTHGGTARSGWVTEESPRVPTVAPELEGPATSAWGAPDYGTAARPGNMSFSFPPESAP